MFLINLYSLGFSAFILENLIQANLAPGPEAFREFGELYLQDRGKRKLPLGTFYRFSSVKKV